ncbi:hypothetical protein VMCG_08885 [Cytospora schulzeri]|uniref:Uncharacterized protein n=1 Tax=Cytospora schulzeri TaxID=448051 RepID=A0A423VUS0_9PEZI|nr:hypothetical protein VMCG_08885 [Valsa malicola]
MCLRVQPVCNACHSHAKTEEIYRCAESACSVGDVEVVNRPLSRMELISTPCSNPECSMNQARLDSYSTWLQGKITAMQQQRGRRQQSLMRSRWATGNEFDNDNSTQQQHQQPLASIFESARQSCASVNNAPSFPFGSNPPGGPFSSVSMPLSDGVATAGVASQANSGWSRKITLTVEESGNVSSSSGGFMNFQGGM